VFACENGGEKWVNAKWGKWRKCWGNVGTKKKEKLGIKSGVGLFLAT